MSGSISLACQLIIFAAIARIEMDLLVGLEEG
jgi:hypothetical protein